MLTDARNAVAIAIDPTYGALGRYASLLNTLHSNDWFEVKHFDKATEAQPIINEKKAFYLALREANHTNPSVIWARVCAFGKAEKYGAIDTAAEINEGEESNETIPKVDKTEPRSPLLRNVQDLITQVLKGLNVNIANLG
jgi:hypothetical protein